jgi:hypothetical protein
MRILKAIELERLVQTTFPGKRAFSARTDLGFAPERPPAMAFVHGGPDPYLDRQVDDWLRGVHAFVGLYPLLNRLCSSGALPPGDYAITGARPQ